MGKATGTSTKGGEFRAGGDVEVSVVGWMSGWMDGCTRSVKVGRWRRDEDSEIQWHGALS
jgi:hypothetical protein